MFYVRRTVLTVVCLLFGALHQESSTVGSGMVTYGMVQKRRVSSERYGFGEESER